MNTATANLTGRQILGTELPTYVFDSSADLSKHIARTVANIIGERNAVGQNAVLGLPAGSSPVGVYRELIRMHNEEGLDFSRVVTFTLNEYYGLGSDRLQSYHRWLKENFFDHINIPEENIHILDGTTAEDKVELHCQQYEEAIRRAGGIDLQLLGIGGNGNVGFNEPFSKINSRSRLVTLAPGTRKAASSDFYQEDNVPMQGLTIGVSTILESRKIIMIALGENKAKILWETVEGKVTERIPATFIRNHPDVAVLVDEAAGGSMTGVITPWLLGQVQWNDKLVKRAVLWLSQKTGKALLKLNERDFRDHGMHQLIEEFGPVQSIAHKVFQWMMNTIEYHPSGKEPSRVICFSPHPDDDVISMGGTLIRLNEDGHETHIAYMTTGNIAVFDHDALRVADLIAEFNRQFGIDEEITHEVEQTVIHSLEHKSPGDPDISQVLKIKELIRWSEAKSGAIVAGCQPEHLHFLDLPFYRTGTIKKHPVSDEDVKIIRQLIEELNPTDLYVAGDLSDPHGTHRVCAEAIFLALTELEKETGTRPKVLLYRGAWQEYPLHEIEVAVPLSPMDVAKKRTAIFRHESQKDSAVFPGSDSREFYQRAEERNQGTANSYNQIGLPEYYAMEAFVRWNGVPI